MEKGPQYISSIQKSVHNTLVQYGKKSTKYKFNMEKCPQLHNTLVQYKKCPQHISSIWKKSPQYISLIWKRVHNILLQYG